MSRFELHERKNLSNERKHGITFQQALAVFNDPLVASKPDRIVNGEQRWQTTGLRGDSFLLVVHTTEDENAKDEVIRIISARLPPVRRDKPMKSNIVSYTYGTLPPVTAAQEARLRAFAARPDSEIDTSDAREMTPEEWKNPERGRFYRPIKQQITARVDADVLAWLKSQGKGYQSRLNDILRREMLKSLQPAPEAAQKEHTAA